MTESDDLTLGGFKLSRSSLDTPADHGRALRHSPWQEILYTGPGNDGVDLSVITRPQTHEGLLGAYPTTFAPHPPSPCW